MHLFDKNDEPVLGVNEEVQTGADPVTPMLAASKHSVTMETSICSVDKASVLLNDLFRECELPEVMVT